MNRGGPEDDPLPRISHDALHPWSLHREGDWATQRGSAVQPGARVLDGGAGRGTDEAMGWNLVSFGMKLTDLAFEDGSFDHAFSVCVSEHPDAGLRKRALAEIRWAGTASPASA